ncbi:MAG TPA: TlpA disulfide reductase family protein [Desulfuromonadales bacterium]|nr:TlpA disulfide reductase family protein [Desulfuromonadales bacterium]
MALWLVSPKSRGAEGASLTSRFNSQGIISLHGLVPEANATFFDLNGHRRRISDFKGKIVLLNLWASWCPNCRLEMPALERLQNKLGHDDFEVVAVDLRESKDKVEKFVKDHNLTFEVLLDQQGEMGRALRVHVIPTTYILGKNGELLGKVMGARDWDSKNFIALFQNLIKDGGSLAAAKAKVAANAK